MYTLCPRIEDATTPVYVYIVGQSNLNRFWRICGRSLVCTSWSCHDTRDRVDFEQSFRYHHAATGLTCSIFPASGDRLPTDPRHSPYIHLMSHLCIVIITILLFAPIIINIIVVLLANVIMYYCSAAQSFAATAANTEFVSVGRDGIFYY